MMYIDVSSIYTCTYIYACIDARSSPRINCTFILQASLNAGLDLKNAVALPDDEEKNDWIAVHGKITTDHVTTNHVTIV